MTSGLSPIQEIWVLNNLYIDENRRVEEIREIIKDLNWRLRPDTAIQIEDHQTHMDEIQKHKTPDITKQLDSFFEGQ